MKRTVKILIPCVLTAVFLGVGIWLLTACIGTSAAYQAETQKAQAALDRVDPAYAEETELAAETLSDENEDLAEEISALEQENTSAEETIAELQGEYDARCLEEETAYFLAIRESLTEGMMLVEDEIDWAQ